MIQSRRSLTNPLSIPRALIRGSSFGVFFVLNLTTVHSAVFTVGRGGGFDFPTMTQAVSAANSGDTLLVAPGVYDVSGGESFPIQIEKEINIRCSRSDAVCDLVGDGASSILRYLSAGSGLLEGFRISGGNADRGGGIQMVGSSPTVRRCVFERNNLAPETAPGRINDGAAVDALTSSPVFEDCLFKENGSIQSTFSLFLTRGSSSPHILNCTFTANVGSVFDCRDTSFPFIINSLIADNVADSPFRYVVRAADSSNATLISCSAVGNDFSGVNLISRAVATIRNCILWNQGTELAGEGFRVTYSCVQGGAEGDGNIESWPRFRDHRNGDWRLANGSPCIDRGDRESSELIPETDLDGSARVVRDGIDMGAFETPVGFVSGFLDPAPPRLYVLTGAEAGGSGLDWENAFSTLSEALFRSLAGSEIWVASGRYRETILLLNDVSLLGGFAGNEGSRSERAPSAHPTILDASGLERPVVAASNVREAIIDGFTITGGVQENGGGITLNDSSARFAGCRIIDNTAESQGGAANLFFSEATFESCEFRRNRAVGFETNGGFGSGFGGAIRSVDSRLTLLGCLFLENRSLQRGCAIDSSNLNRIRESSLEIRDSSFTGNIVRRVGLDSSVILVDEGDRLEISHSIFSKNRMELENGPRRGVAIYAGTFRSFPDFRINGCQISDNERMGGININVATIENCVVAGNDGPGVVGDVLSIHHTEVSSNDGFGINAKVLRLDGSRIQNNQATGVQIRHLERLNVPRSATSTVNKTRVSGNHGIPTGVSFSGATGGIAIGDATVIISDSTVVGNFGAFNASAGGVLCDDSNTTIARCLIQDNTGAKTSGGLLLMGGRHVLNECRIVRNHVMDDIVGGPGVFARPESELTMRNCVVTGNTSAAVIGERTRISGVGLRVDGTQFRLINSTVEGNNSPDGSGGSTGILLNPESSIEMVNSIVWNGVHPLSLSVGSGADISFSNLSVPFEGEGNLSEDPLFLQPWDGATADHRLPCNSPSVDSGTAAGAPGTDIRGVTRPKGGGFDMGAYENCVMDTSGDQVENGGDLLFFPMGWYEPVTSANAPLDIDAAEDPFPRIDSRDLIEFRRSIRR